MKRPLAVAAIVGGLLRIADSFAPSLLSGAALASLYFVTDLFLLLGIGGLYWSRRAVLGPAGTLGTALFVFGILLVRVSAFGLLDYRLGAGVALFGLALLSLDLLLRRAKPVFAALLWLAAFALGLAGAFGVAPETMTLLAGVAFGSGFVAAGLELRAI